MSPGHNRGPLLLVAAIAAVFVIHTLASSAPERPTNIAVQTAPKPTPSPPSSQTRVPRRPPATGAAGGPEGSSTPTPDVLTPAAPRQAATIFASDYRAWADGARSRSRIRDATPSLLGALRAQGRPPPVPQTTSLALRLYPIAHGDYAVTSAIGNFAIELDHGHWLADSTPGY